ncbi:hypothetical protein GOX1328 (plasmid) [Acetobacter orientalis]|jgi:hypothetical protein|uniref:Uncharacterized protein n=1 Tax=Acetobacter orientalis TaxID=146474 RepID=A0A2Z5ZM49_9PROT|nr:hypothetical protein [Acetobacter fabarum]PEN22380.1 hypothetical protein CRM93_13135 [Acetobacter fabarum]BBC81804.1 hypothetical protein GOX1328 [Acetobacter orientalis]
MNMKRMKIFLSCAALGLSLLSQSGAHAGDLARAAATSFDARATEGPSTVPKTGARAHYEDGTGDMLVDSLNASQLDQNYKGPVYYPGQPIPPFRPIDIDHLMPSGPETAKKTSSSHGT